MNLEQVLTGELANMSGENYNLDRAVVNRLEFNYETFVGTNEKNGGVQ